MQESPTPSKRAARELGSVGNALRLLELLARVPEARVTDLATGLGLSKSSIDRLLRTMTKEGFVEQSPESRRYSLSPKILVLAEELRSRTGLIGLARPSLEGLAGRLRETVNLGVVEEDSLVYADTIPSGHIFRIEVRRGMALPLYCTGAGKALLAFMPEEQLEAYLRVVLPIRHTPTTLTTAEAIRVELAEVRRSGVAIDRGELLEESRCAAAPIVGADGLALAAVSVTAPRSHFEARSEEMIAEVKAVAAEVGRQARASGIREAPTRDHDAAHPVA